MKNITAVVLAAGKGKRMRSSSPKVLHLLSGKPLIYYVLKELAFLKKTITQIIVVTGYGADEVKSQVNKDFKGIDFVEQKDLLGTANALQCALDKVKNENVLVLCGDAPLITKKTISSFVNKALKHKSDCSLISAYVQEDTNLGRIIRDSKGNISAIKERVFSTQAEIKNKEVNSGIYLFSGRMLNKYLEKIEKNKRKQEYFLTDIIEILYSQSIKVKDFVLRDSREILGINTQEELILAEKIMRQRVLNRLMESGVKIIDPESTFAQAGVKAGKGTIIYPFTFIEKDVIIGRNCRLGPFLHLRVGTVIKDDVYLGNFVEVNRSVVRQGVRMKHLGYLGDTDVGAKVNIGAGTVVANFDGKEKNKTVIKEGAFLGCDTVLIAPVEIGKGAVTGAGSVITKDVENNVIVAGVPARILRKKR